MGKVIDVFCTIDDDPVLLKRPLMPFTTNSVRIPLFINYQKNIPSWPDEPYYSVKNFEVKSILINGGRYPYSRDYNPPDGYYTIHTETTGTFICVAFGMKTLWMFERLDVVATDKATYSLYGTHDPDGDPNPPMMLNVPDVKTKADALKYSRFSFDQITVNFIWDKQRVLLYGGEMFLSLRIQNDGGGVDNLALNRYIINGIEYNRDTAKITGIDYRYLLNSKYPNETFTRNEYPYIEDAYIDKIKPVCFGIGNGIPGICLNGNQIYKDVSNLNLGKIDRYDFQFPVGWSVNSVIKIEALMSDVWTEIYPGLGNPFYVPNPDAPMDSGAYKPTNNLLKAADMNQEKGIVSVYFGQALSGGERGSAPNKVRMYAEWPNSTMRDILLRLLEASGRDEITEGLCQTLNEEFKNLAKMGLYMDSSKPIFEWVESAQSGNIIGGQLLLDDTMLKFRLENPNRKKRLDIPKADALNHEQVSVKNANELWYSGWEISFKKAWDGEEESEGKLTGSSGRYPTADIYNAQDLTVYYEQNKNKPTIQGFNTGALRRRINILRDMISSYRHSIENVTVPLAKEYYDLLPYDVVGYTPEALEDAGLGDIEWLVYGRSVNIKNETVTLTLVERKHTSFWDHDPFTVKFWINNENMHYSWNSAASVTYPDRFVPENDWPPIETGSVCGGFVFKGWNEKKDGTGDNFTVSTPVTRDTEVYGLWEAAIV